MTPPTSPTALAKDQTPAVAATGTVIPLSEPTARNSPLPKKNLSYGKTMVETTNSGNTSTKKKKKKSSKKRKRSENNEDDISLEDDYNRLKHQPKLVLSPGMEESETAAASEEKNEVEEEEGFQDESLTPYDSKYKNSPYLTPPDAKIERRKYTVDDKFIVNQDSVEKGIMLLPDISNNDHLLDNENDSYLKKMTFLLTGADSEFALKLFILACLMSYLVEIEDNKIGGGKNVPHPLYCFSRFRSDVSTGGECQYYIEIKPPQDTTKFLDETYTTLLYNLNEKDVKTGLLEYSSAIARTNWLRKFLVLYIAWDIDNNNKFQRFKVICNKKKDVVTKVAYSICYNETTTSHNTDEYFTYTDFKKWCQQAFRWIEKLLVNVKENKFRYSKLQNLLQGPPPIVPLAAQTDMDGYLKTMLEPKNATKAKVNTNPRITEELKTEISDTFTEKKRTDKKHIAAILKLCNERKEDFVLEVEEILKQKMKYDDDIGDGIMKKLGNNNETQTDDNE